MDKTQGSEKTAVYFYRGMMWVPHYTLPDLFAGPGNVLMERRELERLGATVGNAPLWPRAKA